MYDLGVIFWSVVRITKILIRLAWLIPKEAIVLPVAQAWKQSISLESQKAEQESKFLREKALGEHLPALSVRYGQRSDVKSTDFLTPDMSSEEPEDSGDNPKRWRTYRIGGLGPRR